MLNVAAATANGKHLTTFVDSIILKSDDLISAIQRTRYFYEAERALVLRP